MYIIEGESFEEVYKKSIIEILSKGQEVAPRGSVTYELAPATLVIKDARKLLAAPRKRKGNYTFQLAELLWMLRGSDDLEEIAHYNKVWRRFEDSDKPGILNGAYGKRLRRWNGYIDQFVQVFYKLKKDPYSRQAVMMIWNPELDNALHEENNYSKDIPCTNYFTFQIRDGKLNMYAVMRSNDLHKGTIYDIPTFITFQHIIAGWLGVEVGKYTHSAASFHIYESDIENFVEIFNDKDDKLIYDGESLSDLRMSIEEYNITIRILSAVELYTRIENDKERFDTKGIIESIKRIDNLWWRSVAAQIAMYNYRKLGATEDEFKIFLPFVTNEYRKIVEGWKQLKRS